MSAQSAGLIAGLITGDAEAGFGVTNSMLAEEIHKRSLSEWKEKWGMKDFETPQSYLDELELLRKQQRQEMPGSTQMRRDIDQTNAGMMSSAAQAAQGSDAMAAVLGAGRNKMRALNQLGAMASQYKVGRQDAYTQKVGQGAQYDIMKYEYNQWLPAQMKANQVMSLMGVGQTMVSSGLNSATANAMNIAGSYQGGGSNYNTTPGYGSPPADDGDSGGLTDAGASALSNFFG